MKLQWIIISFLLFKILKENLKNNVLFFFIIDKSKEVIFVTLVTLENEGQLWLL